MNKKKDLNYMQKALMQAKVALAHDEVPVGAVVVDHEGLIIGRGYNKVERKKSQLFHAEILAIQQAVKRRGNWRLDNCTLYVTLEPCLMCSGLIRLSRIARVCYATTSPLFGAGMGEAIEQKGALPARVEGGLKQQESVDMLKAFFRKAREKKRRAHEAAARGS